VVKMLHSLRLYISSIFSSLLDGKRRKKKVEEELLEVLKELIKDHQDERAFFRSWLQGFQTPATPQVTRSDEADIIEALEDEARLGNVLAQDIVASDEKMRDYIRTIRESY
jgi:hypothetical protein